MLKHLAILTALVIGSFTVAKADPLPITGNLNTAGSTSWYNFGLLTFGGNTVILSSSTGDFASWAGPGSSATYQALNFFGFGSTTSAAGSTIFQGADSAGNPWQIDLLSLNSTNGLNPVNGTVTVAGYGVFMDPSTYANTDVYFTITTQGAAGVPNAYSNLVIEESPVPEPESLALFGTGLLGIVGIARRKFKA